MERASRKLEMNVRGTDSISSVSTSCSEPGSGAGSGDPLALCVAKGNVPNELLQKAALRLIRTEPNSRFSIPQMNSAPPTRGVPLKYLAACMFVLFVSHQWLSRLHPDPGGQQMEVLRLALEGLMDGSLRLNLGTNKSWFRAGGPVLSWMWRAVLSDAFRSLDGYWVFFVDETHTTHELRTRLPEGYLWFDWFGVPQAISRTRVFDEEEDDVKQAEAAKAVDSIPAYVERCNLFVILAPELFHRDTGMICNSTSWQLRGWRDSAGLRPDKTLRRRRAPCLACFVPSFRVMCR
eukprot:g7922.t1